MPMNKNAPVNITNVKALLKEGTFQRFGAKENFESLRQAPS